MKILKSAPFFYRGISDGSTSITIASSATNARWNMVDGVIGWTNAVPPSTFTFIEYLGTDSSTFFQFDASTSQGMISFYLGPIGIQASEIASGFKIGIGNAGSYSAIFNGYYTGGG